MSTTIITEANLVADPDLRVTNVNAQPVCTLRLAVSSRRKNMDGEYVDTPTVFCEGTVWGQLAEHVAESLHKGDRVLVHGSSYDEEWTDREGGTRIKHVLQIQAIGASLRYSTLTIHRARKTTDSDAEVIELQ
jgi:single-strand DNA-binding protein